MYEVVLDTETTGWSYKEGHKIVEIACIETKDLMATGKIFHKVVNPKRCMPEEAFKVNGFSGEYLKDKETFDQIADEFLDFIKDKKLIIHNADFDLSHLNNEMMILGKEKIKNEIVDTLILARNKFPGSSASLDALCKRYRIDNSKREKHTALIDCDLLAKVYINLIDQKEPTLDFQNQDDKLQLSENGNVKYFKKIIKPSLEEQKKHKEFLKTNLKKNFFN